jgi:hypothetical protein
MPYSASINASTIQQWMTANLSPQAIEQELQSKGMDALSIEAHLKEFKKLRIAKRQTRGFVCMALGAVIGFISCVCTVTNAILSLYHIILYGLTSIAIFLIIIGLYFVVE